MRQARVAPGPPHLFPGHGWISRRKGWIEYLRALSSRYGDLVQFRLGGEPAFLLGHPEYAREILVAQADRVVKGGMARNRRLFGDGLLTSEGASHRRQRRMLQPAFHKQKVAGFADLFTETARRVADRWEDAASVDVHRDMRRIALLIAARSLFSAEIDDEIDGFADALEEAGTLLDAATTPLADLLDRLPLGRVRRFERARARLDRTIYRIIESRRKAGPGGSDILSMLMEATDEEEGGGLSDEQVRDECLTLLVAGHETSANAMTWCLWLLAGHPRAAARVEAEADAAGGLPSIDAVPRLPFTEAVFAEAMRLYPPGWILDRRVVAPVTIGGTTIPAGAVVMICPYLMHRDGRFFPDPESFDPDRWIEGSARSARREGAYLAFGAGPRGCIGEAFAWMEGVLVIAALSRAWRFERDPAHPARIHPAIVLRPKGGLRLLVRRRAGQPSVSPTTAMIRSIESGVSES